MTRVEQWEGSSRARTHQDKSQKLLQRLWEVLSSRWYRRVLGGAHPIFRVISNYEIICSSVAVWARSFPEWDPAIQSASCKVLCPAGAKKWCRNAPLHQHISKGFGRIAEVQIQVGGSWKAALAAFLPVNKSCCTKAASLLEKKGVPRHWKYIHGRKWLESSSAQTRVPSCIFLDNSCSKQSRNSSQQAVCIQPPSPGRRGKLTSAKRAFCASWPQGPGYTEFLDAFSLLARNCLSLEPDIDTWHHRASLDWSPGAAPPAGRVLPAAPKKWQRSHVDAHPAPAGFKFKRILSVEVELRDGLVVVALAVRELLDLMQEGFSDFNDSIYNELFEGECYIWRFVTINWKKTSFPLKQPMLGSGAAPTLGEKIP